MRQDVRKTRGKGFPSEQGWFNRLKGLVDYGKSLLKTQAERMHAEGVKSEGPFDGGDGVIGGDGAAVGARHSRMPRHFAKTDDRPAAKTDDRPAVKTDKRPGETDKRPTRKEAKMSTNAKQSLRVHIRWMIRRDMGEVLDIERGSFEFPWHEEDFIRCLRQRNCIGMVAEHGERVVGFMIYELHKTRLHILNFAVADAFRYRDVGRQMADKLISKLSSQRRTRISLEVRETNLTAQLFFKQLGFRATTVLRSYYEDSPEDAYLMQFRYVPVDVEATLPIPGSRLDRLAG